MSLTTPLPAKIQASLSASSLQVLLERFKRTYENLISTVVAVDNSQRAKAYKKALAKAKFTPDDIARVLAVWDSKEYLESLLSATWDGKRKNEDGSDYKHETPKLFAMHGVLFDFYDISGLWPRMTLDQQDSVVFDLRSLYLIAKAIAGGSFISEQMISAVRKLQPDMKEDMVLPLQDIRNILLYDVKPTVMTVRESVIAYSVNGKNIARDFLARCVTQAREYVPDVSLPPNIERMVLRAMNRAVVLIMSFGENDDISMIEIVPQAFALVSKLSREFYAQDGLAQELEDFVKDTVTRVKNGTNGTDFAKMLVSFTGTMGVPGLPGSSDQATIEMPDDVKEGLEMVKTDKEQKALDEAAAQAKVNSIIDRLKAAFNEGHLEDTVIEILHEHPVILNSLRTKFPDLEILKRQVKPKTREERLRAILKHKREQRGKR